MSGFIFIRQRLLTFVDSADLHGFEDVEVAAATHLSAKGASQSDEGESFLLFTIICSRLGGRERILY